MEKSVNVPERSIIGDDGKLRKKTIHDYSAEELDALEQHDPDYELSLWADGAVDALNNPENHDKSS